MPLQAKPFRSTNEKGHLDGQDIWTTLANEQTKDGHLLFQKIQLKVTTPAEQNTYGLIFVKQNYESLKATTPRGAKHLRSQVYVYGNDREAKPLRPEKIDNQLKGI